MFVFILSLVLIALITTIFSYYDFMNFCIEASNIKIVEVIPEAGVFLWLSPPAVGILAVKWTCSPTVVAYLQRQ